MRLLTGLSCSDFPVHVFSARAGLTHPFMALKTTLTTVTSSRSNYAEQKFITVKGKNNKNEKKK